MEGDVFFTGDRRTDVQTDGHHDSMTELAQWADSVKILTEFGSRQKIVYGMNSATIYSIMKLCLFCKFGASHILNKNCTQ